MAYSLGTIFLSEMTAMWWVITFGNSLLANELLRKTKGHEMGFGFIALFFGLSFFFPILVFSPISAKINPAAALADLVIGKINFSKFIVITCGDMVGAFLGAVTAYVLYLGHFSLVPQLPSRPHWTDKFTKPNEPGPPSRWASYFGVDKQEARAAAAVSTDFIEEVQVESPDMANMESGYHPEDTTMNEDVHSGDAFSSAHTSALHSSGLSIRKPPRRKGSTDSMCLAKTQTEYPDLTEEEWAHAAAMIADQCSKLSVFSTRPAIYNWWQNLLTEAIGTFLLLWGVIMSEDIVEFLSPDATASYKRVFFALWVSLYIAACVAALGGPTGYSANPARDLGPRIAHFVLPIANKGSSEWHYAWIASVGPLIGGVMAGGLYYATEHFY